MLNLDGAAHTRLRRRVVKAFTPRTVEALRPRIERMVDDFLEPLTETHGGDVLDALGFPLPVSVIGELLGVPEADRAQFRSIASDSTAVLEPRPTAAQLEAADAAVMTSRAYFTDLIAEKRKRPSDDLLSRLALRADGEDPLTDDELATLGSLLFAAGFETTTNLIGNGLFALLQHPDQMRILRSNPSLHRDLPQELLRYDGTAQLTNRITKADVEVDGVTIPKGEVVAIVLGAANHDSARYENPDALDVTRTDIQPLSFGGGVHYCLGAALAEVEVEVAFRRLFGRFESIELDGERPRYRDRLALRGLESLAVKCQPRSTARQTCPMHGASLGLRPAAGSSSGDAAWRNTLRARVEREADAVEKCPHLLDTIVLLARAPLFRSCTAADLAELAATAYPMGFEPGEYLCVEGNESLECYVIAEGETTVTISGRVVRMMAEDDVVGERGLLESRPRSATVTAATHVNTWAISRERLSALVGRSAAVKAAMHDYVERRYVAP